MRLPNHNSYRNVVFFAVAVAVALILLCVTELVASYPFQPFMGQTIFDVTFLISSAILLYMCWHTWHDLELGDEPHRQYNATDRIQSRTSPGRNAKPSRTERGAARRGNRSRFGHRTTVL